MGKNLRYFRIVVKLFLREITNNQGVNRISVCYWLIAQSRICKTTLASFPGHYSHFQFGIACSVLQKFLHPAGNDICFFVFFVLPFRIFSWLHLSGCKFNSHGWCRVCGLWGKRIGLPFRKPIDLLNGTQWKQHFGDHTHLTASSLQGRQFWPSPRTSFLPLLWPASVWWGWQHSSPPCCRAGPRGCSPGTSWKVPYFLSL